MLVLVHSPWLPGDIDVVQTILVILTMAGLFLDRPHILVSVPSKAEPEARTREQVVYLGGSPRNQE